MLGVLLLGACTASPNYGFAVALTMQFDDSIDDATLAQITHVNLQVPEEGYADDIMLGRSAHRTERVVYRPNLGATSLSFELTAGSTSNTIAYGQRVVTVQPNVTTFAEIVLSAGAGPDGGMNDGGDDDAGGPKPTLSFVTTPLIATAHQPLGVVIADFNGDGLNDVAVAASAGSVSVFLAAADHSLPAIPSSTNTSVTAPGALAVGDFGGDTSLDLVVTDESTNTLVFLINDGHASFTAATLAPPTPAGADSLAVADFDHDGHPDVAVASSTTASISVCLSIATPPYVSPLSYATAQPVARLRSADFNGDGYYDLIYAEPAANMVGIRISANGNFGSQAEQLVSFNAPYDVLTYPFLPGKPEAVLLGTPDSSANDALLLDNDSGVLQIDSNLPFGTGLGFALRYASALDFEGTGLPYVIATNYTMSGGAFTSGGADLIQVGKTGAGSPFVTRVAGYVSGVAPDAFAVGDLDGDGLNDIAVVNRGSDTLAVMRQLSGGQLYAAPSDGIFSDWLRVGDFNGDGKPDLIDSDGTGAIYCYLGDGLGNFAISVHVPALSSSVAVADVNEDGLSDLVFGSLDGKLGVGLATSPGNFAPVIYTGAIGTYFIDTLARDLDGDGHVDAMVLARASDGNPSGKNLTFVHGDGHGDFTAAPTSYPASGAIAMLPADLDEDGHVDVLALSATPAQIAWLRGQAGDPPVAGATISSPVTNATSFVTCDANQDGHVDLVIGGDSLHVLIGDGHGGFTDGGELFSAQPTVSVVAGDLDGDGVPEVIAATADSVVRVFRVQNGALVPAGVFAAGGFLSRLLGADFTGDHLVDLFALGSQGAFLKNDTK
jgi:hypothetical protein